MYLKSISGQNHILTEMSSDLEQVNQSINILSDRVAKLSSPANQVILDNAEFCQMMNISKKTAQKWRDENKIDYRAIERKIYYSLADVLAMLDDHKIDRIIINK